MFRRAVGTTVCVASLWLVLAGCTKSEAQREAEARKAAMPARVERDGSIRLSAADRAALNLEIAPATEGPLAAGTLRFGKVETAASDDVILAAPITGRISAIPTVAGVAVAAGASVATIVPAFDASERVALSVQAADIEGQIAELEKETRVKDADAARARQLAQQGIASAASEQAAVADAAAAHARLDALRREKSGQASNAGRIVSVRAPIGGTLAEIRTTAGSVVHEGDVIARIVRGGERLIDLPVVANEPVGDRYSVLAAGAWLPARLVARGGEVESDGFRHDRLTVTGSSAWALLPGSTISVRVSRGAPTGVVVPDPAVVTTSRGDLVYVQRAPGVYEPRVVHVAERSDAFVRIDRGLAPGETIVVRGATGLYGESVRSALE